MSAISSRSRISGVVITAAAGTVITGAVLAGRLLRAVGGVAYSTWRELNAARSTETMEVRPLCAIRQERWKRSAAQGRALGSLSAVEAIKLEASQCLADYVHSDADRLMAPLRALVGAATVGQARSARDALLEAAEAEHHSTFTNRLVTACSRASVATGFETIETHALPDGTVRVVATNEAGLALVTEIHNAPNREPSLATEVLGMYDGTCHEILDQFDAALEAEGVRSAKPHRRFTGGVCELAAAREFVRRKLRPSEKTQATSSARQRARRRRIGGPPQRQR